MRNAPGLNALILLAAASASNCSSTTTTPDEAEADSFRSRRSSLPYQTNVNAPAADLEALESANRTFTFSLYHEVAARADAQDNLFLGTESIATLLAMTSAGAAGVTEAEIATVLGHGLASSSLHPAANAYGQALSAGLDGSTVSYTRANSIWLSEVRQTMTPFLDVLSQHYDTGVYLADFAADPEGARQTINQWTSQETEGKIPELLSSGLVDEETEIVLANAVALAAPWQDRFDKQTTETDEFRLPDGTVVDVQMMGREYQYPFALDFDWQALELPFAEANMGMVFVLPTQGRFEEVEASFDAALAAQIVDRLEAQWDDPCFVWARVPRFDFDSNVDLAPSLRSLGMNTAFEELTANFSAIDPDSELYIQSFVHRTTVSVDEDGVTGAAASGAVMVPSAIVPRVHLDRPFLFFIYDHVTGSVLFVGRLVRPPGSTHAPTQAVKPSDPIATICGILADCSDRTLSESECSAALTDDDASVLADCAHCISLARETEFADPSCVNPLGSACDPSTCSAHCPDHPF